MRNTRNLNCGCYVIVIKVSRDIWIRVGKLGEFLFPKGFYSYTGSAMKGLEERVKRHRSQRKKFHWHIDYLLANKAVRILEVLTLYGRDKEECNINLGLKQSGTAKIMIRGFGSSDCKAGCGSHLLYWGKKKINISI